MRYTRFQDHCMGFSKRVEWYVVRFEWKASGRLICFVGLSISNQLDNFVQDRINALEQLLFLYLLTLQKHDCARQRIARMNNGLVKGFYSFFIGFLETGIVLSQEVKIVSLFDVDLRILKTEECHF